MRAAHARIQGELLVNVTLDLATVLVVGLALAVGCMVHRGMAPAAGTGSTTSKGDRLTAAVAAAAGVIVIGSFLVGGVQIGQPSGGPAPGPAATSTGSVR
ncbi:hypothetical protein ABZ725_49000 [Streptomyces sp. NPDC006872]|uniref:hypothetical protein n=1 Tax=Streptomyces sp. NPDC006872 TaxID=3155720 RepID=UPI0033DE4BE7